MSHDLVKIPEAARNLKDSHGFYDDFDHFVTADRWTFVGDAGETQAVTDAAGGVISIACDGDDEDEAYIHTTYEMFLFAQNKPIVAEVRQSFEEAATDDANCIVGFFNAFAAAILVDAGAGPKTTGSGFGFFKKDGETLWSVYASNGSSQTKVQLTASNSRDGIAKTAEADSTGTYQVLKFEFCPSASDRAHFHFHIDGIHVYTISDFDYSSSPTEMDLGFGIKAGGGATETLFVDYAYAYQSR